MHALTAHLPAAIDAVSHLAMDELCPGKPAGII